MPPKSLDILQQLEHNFECPITQVRLIDPVMTDDGHTYERKAIKAWIAKSKTSPLTGAKLNTKVLRPNFLVKEIINAFYEHSIPKQIKRLKDEIDRKVKQIDCLNIEALINQRKRQEMIEQWKQKLLTFSQKINHLQLQLKKHSPPSSLTRSLLLSQPLTSTTPSIVAHKPSSNPFLPQNIKPIPKQPLLYNTSNQQQKSRFVERNQSELQCYMRIKGFQFNKR